MNRKLPITVLYAEDDAATRQAVVQFLSLCCARVTAVGSGRHALKALAGQSPDVILTDIRMPGMDGLELVELLRAHHCPAAVILTSAFSEPAYLLRAIELGVSGFLQKPLDYPCLEAAIHKATLSLIQERESRQLRSQRVTPLLPGTSPQMAYLAEQVALVADSRYSVLIGGEKGSGKSRVAHVIHALGSRNQRPILSVNCATKHAGKLEAELFGDERPDTGVLVAAGEGSVLLQGVDQAPHEVQVRLLDFIQDPVPTQAAEGEGGSKVRILSTVSGDPGRAVNEKRLLEGLYYQLNDLTLMVPALREVTQDIETLALLFLAEGAREAGSLAPLLDSDAVALLQKHTWPGNLRELKCLMRRAVLYVDKVVTAGTLESLLNEAMQSSLMLSDSPASLKLAFLEKWAIKRVLQATNGRKMQAAGLLGLDYKRFQRKMAFYGLR